MIRNLADVATSERLDYDIVVIGAGAAGITLALELMDSGLRVAVLEGGTTKQTTTSQRRYKGELTVGEGMEYPDLDAWRLRFLGGTTNHWVGWCRPLEENVFLPRPGITEASWPWPRTELDAAYLRGHEICELGKPEYDPKTLCEGVNLPVPVEPSAVLAPKVWRFSPPTRFGTKYADQLRDGSVEVFLGANCTGLVHTGARVTSANVVTDDRTPYSFTAKQFVLACGGIDNVRQLLMAAEGGLPGLNDSGLLGVGFAEHPHFTPALAVVPKRDIAEGGRLFSMVSKPKDETGTRFRVALALSEEVLKERRFLNMSFTLDPLSSGTKSPEHTGAVRSLWSSFDSREYTVVRLQARTEQHPNQESRIRLTDVLDDLGLPRVGLDWRIGDTDRADAVAAARLVGAEMLKQGLGPVYAGTVPGLETITGGAHHLGGARMHESAAQGVVDPNLKCHSVDNLYVASSAVFPTTCFSNPTLTIVALSVRLAATLKERS